MYCLILFLNFTFAFNFVFLINNQSFKNVVGTQKNRLNEAVLLSTENEPREDSNQAANKFW